MASKCCFLLKQSANEWVLHRTFKGSHTMVRLDAMSSRDEGQMISSHPGVDELLMDAQVSKLDMNCKVECLYLCTTDLC